MSYSIRHVEADRWTVINDDDVAVFTGSLRDCEDWLDSWENASRPRRSPWQLLIAPLRRLFGGPPDAAPPHAAERPEQPSRGMNAERRDVPHSQAS